VDGQATGLFLEASKDASSTNDAQGTIAPGAITPGSVAPTRRTPATSTDSSAATRPRPSVAKPVAKPKAGGEGQ
jgi:hypothetical protein